MIQRFLRPTIVVRFRSFATVLAALVIITAMTSRASAQPVSDQQRQVVVLGTVRAATDCITVNVFQYGLTAQSANRPLSDAIRGVIASRACDELTLKMIGTIDRVNGYGSGVTFFSGAYASDLPRAVRARLAGRQMIESPAPSEGSEAVVKAYELPSGSLAINAPAKTLPTAAQSMVLPYQSPSSSIAALNIRSADSRRSMSPEELAADRTFDMMMASAAGILGIAGGATFVLFLIGLGSRWVVFSDGTDLVRTATVVLAPIGTGLVAALEIARLGLASGQPNAPLNKAFVLDHPTMIVILGIGLLAFSWAFLTTFTASIRHNGLIMGTPIAILRIVAALFTPVAMFGLLHAHDLGRSQKRPANGLGGWLLVGVLVWLGSMFINGSRVREREKRLND